MRPSASLSSSIFSPGCTPRCCSTSLRNVTCPRAVTVNVVMTNSSPDSLARDIVMQKSITSKRPEVGVSVWIAIALGDPPRPIPSPSGRLAQPEFGDEVLGSTRRNPQLVGDHPGRDDRAGQHIVKEGRQPGGRAAAVEFSGE